MKQILHFSLSILLLFGLSEAWSQATTFSYTGGVQSYTVPPGVTSIQLEAWGAQGGTGTYGGVTPDPGLGGYAVGEMAVTPGQVLEVYVGGQGDSDGPGGYNGGGQSATNYGAAGGGASDVRVSPYGLNDRSIVGAGGGGAAFGSTPSNGGHGGALIGLAGENGDSFVGGGGGTQVAGGAAGCCYGAATGGTFGLGGGPGDYHNAGGGGGWYGGGSGAGQAGAGGGSSYIEDLVAASTTAGVRTGEGQVIITVLCSALELDEVDMELCRGDLIILDATSESGASIEWDGGVTDGVEFEPPVGTTTYTATSDADDDCPLTIEIVVYELPVVTATASEVEICEGDEVTFTGGGATTYEWSPDGVVDGEPYSIEETGVFTVIGTDDNGCENEEEVEVTVYDLPTVEATADAEEICDGDELTLTGEGAEDYDWDMGVTDGEAFVPEVGTETYTVTGTDDNGCENTDEITVTVNELPEVTATASETEVCFGYEVTFTGDGATDYEWDMGVTDGVPAIMDTEGTVTFTVIGTDDNGCENTASVDVIVTEEIEVTVTTVDDLGGGEGGIDITVTGGVAPYTFDWDNDGTGDFDDTEDLADLAAGTYTVVVMDDNGCTTTVEITVDSQAGIGESKELGLNVYPNPTTDFITVEFEGLFTFELTDINGAIIAQATATDKEQISLANVADGIYFIIIKSNEATHAVKVVKK